MAGGWNPEAEPKRSGFYNNIVAVAEEIISAGTGGIAAMSGVFNWGPVGETVRVTSVREYEAAFGKTANIERFGAVGAFTGNGEPGNGVSEILVHRPAISGQAKAAITLEHTGETNAITLTAKHFGTLGNGLSVTTRDYLADAAYNELLVFLSGVLVESYTYLNADIDGLAAQINDDSRYLTATVLVNTTALADVSAQALTGGLDGTVTVGDYSEALEALETERINLIFIPGLTDATMLAALRQWTIDQNAGRRRVMMVEGGLGNESMATAVTRSQLSDTSGDVVNVGYSQVRDPDGTLRSTADMTGYIVGMIAAAGASRAITFDRLPDGFELVRGAVDSDIEVALDGGVITFAKDADGVRIERGITTYTDDTDPNMLKVLSRIKFVRTIHLIENGLTEVTEGQWIGKVPNDQAGRDSYVGMVKGFFKDMADARLIKPSLYVELDETQDNDGDTLYLRYGIEFVAPIERVLALGGVSA